MVPFLEGDSFIFGVDCFFCPKRKYIKGSSSNFQLPGIFRCSAWWVWGGGLEGWNCLQYTPWNFNILAPDKRPFPSKNKRRKSSNPIFLQGRAVLVSGQATLFSSFSSPQKMVKFQLLQRYQKQYNSDFQTQKAPFLVGKMVHQNDEWTCGSSKCAMDTRIQNLVALRNFSWQFLVI